MTRSLTSNLFKKILIIILIAISNLRKSVYLVSRHKEGGYKKSAFFSFSESPKKYSHV